MYVFRQADQHLTVNFLQPPIVLAILVRQQVGREVMCEQARAGSVVRIRLRDTFGKGGEA